MKKRRTGDVEHVEYFVGNQQHALLFDRYPERPRRGWQGCSWSFEAFEVKGAQCVALDICNSEKVRPTPGQARQGRQRPNSAQVACRNGVARLSSAKHEVLVGYIDFAFRGQRDATRAAFELSEFFSRE